MSEIEELKAVIKRLRAKDGCPWDREQTHASLKPGCIEEACEVICGINIYEETGNADNMLEELGDLLLQIVMQAEIADEEGLFNFEDVARVVKEKMIRRHPHVFGEVTVKDSDEVLANWADIKAEEKRGKEWMDEHMPAAFEESQELIKKAIRRKEEKKAKS